MMNPNRIRIMVAEAIGTFALCFVGVLAIVSDVVAGSQPSPVSLTVVALAHGLILSVMIAALSSTSGAHFNPAVTFGFLVTGRMPITIALLYWVAQLAGAIIASFMIMGMTSVPVITAGTPIVAENVGTVMAIILEAVA